MNKLVVIVLSLIILNSLLISATKDPIINISLSKHEYLQKEKLLGDITLTFTDQAEDKDVEIRFNQNSDITKVSQILDVLGENYETISGKKELTPLEQPDGSVIFPPLVQELGISVSKEAEGAIAEVLEKVNNGFEAGKVNRSQVASWMIMRLRDTFTEKDILAIRSAHFDEISLLESILRQAKERGNVPQELREVLQKHAGFESLIKKKGH